MKWLKWDHFRLELSSFYRPRRTDIPDRVNYYQLVRENTELTKEGLNPVKVQTASGVSVLPEDKWFHASGFVSFGKTRSPSIYPVNQFTDPEN